jgi:hypothetical protein
MDIIWATITVLLVILVLISPLLFWLINGARQSLVKRGVLIALATWTVIGAWQWYQWDRYHLQLACIVKKQDSDRAINILRQHGIKATLVSFTTEKGDYCRAFVPNYQARQAAELVPGDRSFLRSE